MGLAKHIPNTLTCMNLVCGTLGILATAKTSTWHYVPYLIWAGGLFDLLDGLVARQLKVSSPIGKQLDSLADVVTFGVLPALFMLQIIGALTTTYMGYAAIALAVAAALRLAKFNVDNSQTDEFTGMPTPAAALLISGLYYWLPETPAPNHALATLCLAGTLSVAALMVSNLRFFSLKQGGAASRTSKAARYVLLALAVLAIALLYFRAVAIIMILYILLSVVNHLFTRKTPSKHNSE